MTAWLPVALAAAAALVLVAVPAPGAVRLAGLRRAVAPRVTRAPWALGVGIAAFVLLGPVAAAVATLGCVAARRAVRVQRQEVALARERGRALEALAVVAGDLRAGRTAADALAAAASVAVGGTGAVLATAASAARLGGDVPAALRGGASAVPEALRSLAACWAVCTVAGSGLATGVERLVDGLREAEAQRHAVDAELAGPRATALLLAGLPLAGVALAGALGADPLHVLLHTPAGVACLVGGLALDAAGLLWARRLVAGATS